MSKHSFYFIILIILFTPSSTTSEGQQLQEDRPLGETHKNAGAEAIVKDHADINANVNQGKESKSVTSTKKPTAVTNRAPQLTIERFKETNSKTASAHGKWKHGEPRRLLEDDKFPHRPVIHDSRHMHEFNDKLDLEDQMGAGQWANRWFYETTRSYYRNVTIELLTFNEGSVKNWVTMCPGHHYIKFKIRTHSDGIVYLSDHFRNVQTDVKVIPCFVKIQVGAESSYIIHNNEDMKYNYAYHVHPPGQRYNSGEEFRGFWIWWDGNGLILVGREHKPPFIAYYINKYQGKRWKVKAVGFGGFIPKETHTFATWHINVEFPIHEDPDYDAHSDELSDQDLFA